MNISQTFAWNLFPIFNIGVGTTSHLHKLLNFKWPYLRLQNTYAFCFWYGEKYCFGMVLCRRRYSLLKLSKLREVTSKKWYLPLEMSILNVQPYHLSDCIYPATEMTSKLFRADIPSCIYLRNSPVKLFHFYRFLQNHRIF